MYEYNGKQVTIMSCSDCNANCEHCYISYEGNFTGKDLLEMCKNFEGKYKIIINGTEVLLHDDYFDALKISNQNRVLTNGIIIYTHPEILDKIKACDINKVAMSYHFDSNVSHVSQKMVEDCIKIIKDKGMEPELMCTITKENYDKIDEILEKVHSLGVKTIRFFNCLNIGNNLINENDNILDKDELNTFFDNIYKEREKYPIEELRIKRNGTFGKDERKSPNNFRCPAGVDEVVITPSLDVYPCIYMTKKGYEIGKYVDGKIMLYDVGNTGDKCIAQEVFNKDNYHAFQGMLGR